MDTDVDRADADEHRGDQVLGEAGRVPHLARERQHQRDPGSRAPLHHYHRRRQPRLRAGPHVAQWQGDISFWR